MSTGDQAAGNIFGLHGEVSAAQYCKHLQQLHVYFAASSPRNCGSRLGVSINHTASVHRGRILAACNTTGGLLPHLKEWSPHAFQSSPVFWCIKTLPADND